MTTRLAFAAVLTVGLVASSAQDGYPGDLAKLPPVRSHYVKPPGLSYQLAAPLPEGGRSTCPVFMTVPAADVAAKVERLGRLLGVSGALISTGESVLIHDWGRSSPSPSESRWVYGSRSDGTIRYVDTARLFRAAPEGMRLPTEEEAWTIAERFLATTQLELAGMKRDSIAYVFEQENPIGMTLAFRRTLEGSTMTGPGGKVYVDLGSGGDVVGLLYVWRPAVPMGDYPLATVDQALQRMHEGGCVWVNIPDNATAVVLQESAVAYWEEPPHSRQDFIQPVYVFKGRAFRHDKDIGEANVIVPAVASTHVTEGAPPSGPPS